jgi:hypothetical protein
MFVNFVCSSWDFRDVRSLESESAGLGVPGVGVGCGGLSCASSRKVDATENWPSRRRCIAIARFMSEGCEARASYSVGRVLTGKFYQSSVYSFRGIWSSADLIQCFSITALCFVHFLEIIVDFIEATLHGILHLCKSECMGAWICEKGFW